LEAVPTFADSCAGGLPDIELELADQSIHLDADADKLRQELVNLLCNACDASPAGTGNNVETSIDGGVHGAPLTVANKTTGGAINVSQIMRPCATAKPRGTGVGLAVVRNVVGVLHGRVSVALDETGEVRANAELGPLSPGAGGTPPTAFSACEGALYSGAPRQRTSGL
jgi:C4-dicarboxylate-specific signal transduction histidine kinase